MNSLSANHAHVQMLYCFFSVSAGGHEFKNTTSMIISNTVAYKHRLLEFFLHILHGRLSVKG